MISILCTGSLNFPYNFSEIKDFTYEAIRTFLLFLYTDQVAITESNVEGL